MSAIWRYQKSAIDPFLDGQSAIIASFGRMSGSWHATNHVEILRAGPPEMPCETGTTVVQIISVRPEWSYRNEKPNQIE